MEQTPLPPLVSRDRYAEYAAQYTYPTSREVLRALEKFADLHEAHHAKTREVVQALYNALADPHKMSLAASALALAKSLLQIEPTK